MPHLRTQAVPVDGVGARWKLPGGTLCLNA